MRMGSPQPNYSHNVQSWLQDRDDWLQFWVARAAHQEPLPTGNLNEPSLSVPVKSPNKELITDGPSEHLRSAKK